MLIGKMLEYAIWFFSADPRSRSRQLTQLSELDDRLLRDINVSRQEATSGRRNHKAIDAQRAARLNPRDPAL